MSDTEDYRVMTRSTAMSMAASALAVGAVLVWASMIWIESYGDRLSALQALSPQDAAAKLAGDLRTFAVAQLVVLVAFGLFLVWYGRKALRSRSMPPTGSWVIQGQHIRKGRSATTAASALIACAALLIALAGVSAFLLWRLAATI
jgi:hypothetical protein